jgi:integrase
MECDLEMGGQEIAEAIRARHVVADAQVIPPSEEASFIVSKEGFDAPPGSQEMGMVANAVRVGMERGYQRVAALSAGTVFPSMPRASDASAMKTGLTIEEAARRYLAHKNLPVKTVSEVTLTLRLFKKVIGNKALDSIKREDCLAFVEHLSNHKVGGKTAGSIERTIAPGTVKKRIGFLNSIINHAEDRGWFDGKNPASNIRLSSFVKKADVVAMPIKRRLKVDEINKILQHPWFTGCKSASEPHLPGNYRLGGSEYWAIMVALFTGCRAGELGGLRLAEVRLAGRCPHIIIQNNEYRRTKGGYARNVPILDVLMDLGFADYVDRIQRTGADRVFPDWTARKAKAAGEGDFPAWSNAAVIRAFNRTVIPAALGDILRSGTRQEVTFHSLRGAFKSMLGTNHNVPTNIVHEIVGHAKSELDARYIGTIEIEVTYPAVRSCTYAGLIVPPPPAIRT